MIYLDNAATTKPYPEAVAKAAEIMAYTWGNPSSGHEFGALARLELDNARKIVANALGASPGEVYFTSGGTEADNIAILGGCLARKNRHVVTTAIEHAAVAKTIRNLRREHGFAVDYIPLKGGRLDLEALENTITEQTSMVSVMLVGNEVGTIQPVAEISRIVKRKNRAALLHCDAVQGFSKLPFTVDSLGVDMLSISAHKIGGIQGCGALYLRSGTRIFARQFGGGQENGLRSGTESVPLIAAFGEATRLTFASPEKNAVHMTDVRNYCIAELSRRFSTAVILTDKACAPHIISFTLPDTDAAQTVAALGNHGICISNGAACQSNERDNKRGQALEAYGLTDAEIRSTLRVSLCSGNTREDIDAMVAELLHV